MADPITNGTRSLLIASVELEQNSQSGRLPNIAPGTVFWATTRQAAGLVAGGLATYAPAGTPLPRAEPPLTAGGTPGFGTGTSNCSA